MTEKQITMKIDHGSEGFYSDSVSIVYNPNKFILDFKQISPRIDQIQGKSQQTLVVKHNTIFLDPSFAKIFFETLSKSVKGFEKKYGKIKTPKRPKQKPVEEVVTSKDESYIG
jgi:hypothetical protein